jgi:DNA-binding response OmpR family regulator
MLIKPADAPSETSEERFRVLVVDDNPDAADSLTMLIRCWGYESRAVYDSQLALAAAADFNPHCFVLDIAMPGLDGYELARQVRHRPEHSRARLVALTAFSNETHQSRLRDAGFDYNLTKPADPGELERLMRMLAQTLKLVERTKELTEQNIELSRETKDLLLEMKDELNDVKEEVRDLKTELRDFKTDQNPP